MNAKRIFPAAVIAVLLLTAAIPAASATIGLTENPLSGTTEASPLMQNSLILKLAGTATAGNTIKVYLNGTAMAVTAVQSDGTWTINVLLAPGVLTKVELAEADGENNESERYPCGYVIADASAPLVAIDVLPATTTEPSITISGTVTKDAWELYSDITLTVQVGDVLEVVPINDNGSYECTVPLPMGANAIMMYAVDKFGNASTSLTVTVERVAPPCTPAAVNISPYVLSHRSQGKWITCSIKLPGGGDKNIDVSTVRLVIGGNEIPAEPWLHSCTMVKFSRQAVLELLGAGEHEVKVVGYAAGIPFEGSDVIRIRG